MSRLKEYADLFTEPFGSTLHRYYLTPELSQRIKLIHHLIQNSEQLLYLKAETGSGKTALLNQLKKMADHEYEHWWIYTLKCNQALSPERAISQILATFNVRQEGKPISVLQESLRNHIAATRYNGQLPILFVDDAHQLPKATLKFIVELAMQGEQLTRTRVLLFCEPQITSILATPEFEIVQNKMTHTIDIPPFSAIQVRDYLQFCLQGSRYNTFHPFSSEVIKKIHADSEGIPGEINQYAAEILQQFAQDRHDLTFSYPLSYSKLLWGIPIVLILIGIALWFYWQTPDNEETLPAFLTGSDTIIEPPPPSLEAQLPRIPMVQEQKTGVTDSTPITVPTWKKHVDVANAKESSLSKQITSPAIEDSKNKTQSSNIKGEDWLRQQNPNAYTIQIIGVHDRLILKKFLDKHNNENIVTFKTRYRNKNWYVIIYGVYPTRFQAKQALATLPASLQENEPWLRSFASVQKAIK
jgi:DamX protein